MFKEHRREQLIMIQIYNKTIKVRQATNDFFNSSFVRPNMY